MKSSKSQRGTGKVAAEEGKQYFAISTILLNLIAIVVLGGVYYFIVTHELFPSYQNYIYWTINVLISYNIIIASTRSLWAPLLSTAVGALGIYSHSSSSMLLDILRPLTDAQCWQLAILGVVGLLICFALRL